MGQSRVVSRQLPRVDSRNQSRVFEASRSVVLKLSGFRMLFCF